MGLVEDARVFTADDLDGLGDRVADIGELIEGFGGEAVAVAGLLELAKPTIEARYVTAVSDDGLYTASIPLSEIREKGWLVYKLGDEALPRGRGGPFRIVVPQGRTLCWNVKAVATLRVTAEKEPDSVPADPKH
jgi:DMSO/TMAO reductase YedYZ molybdopterin-dependent catalytic subunit